MPATNAPTFWGVVGGA